MDHVILESGIVNITHLDSGHAIVDHGLEPSYLVLIRADTDNLNAGSMVFLVCGLHKWILATARSAP